MLRHRLAALFEPHSLLVLADRALPITHSLPAALLGSATLVDAQAGLPIAIPAPLNGVEPGARLDLALVCVAPDRLPQALEALAVHRPRSIILLRHEASGGDPIEGMAYCSAWARLNDCLILGPRSFGLQRPVQGLNLSHEPKAAWPGRVALVAQSNSIAAAVLDWADAIHLGFSTVISVGDESVIDVPAVLDYLAMDPDTDSIALYLENTSSSRQFTSALRAAAGVKPVIVLKTGYASFEPDSAEDMVFNALLRRAGAVRVRYFVQLFSALKVLAHAQRPRGRRIALFSNGHSAPQLALDVMGPDAVVLRAELSQHSIKALGRLLEPGAQAHNPVITHAALEPAKVEQAIAVLADDPGVDGVLVLLAPDPFSDMPAIVAQLAAIAPSARKPIVICLMGDAGMGPLRHVLDDVGAPAFRTPESAASAFGILASYHYNQILSQQILPPEALGKPPEIDRARALLRAIQDGHRQELEPAECRQLFECFHIPVRIMPSAAQPGGELHDDNPPMSIRVCRDSRFGPYITFGSGGREVLASLRDRGLDLPPLNSYLARQLVERSVLWRRALSRQISPAAFDGLQESLERISDLVCGLPEVETLEIDPLFAGGMPLWALAVRVRLAAAPVPWLPETSGYRHMAIHPYPARLVQAKTFRDGRPWLMRPIRPEDAEPLQAFVRGLSDESRYMRFISVLRELTPRMLARYTRIDYDRELALVATVQAPNPAHRGHPREQIIGFAHYLRNADGRGAEYALVIGDDWQRCGLGSQLMRGLIEAAQEQGLTYIDGLVLNSNRPMLNLMTRLGFKNDRDAQDPGMRRVWLDLGETRIA